MTWTASWTFWTSVDITPGGVRQLPRQINDAMSEERIERQSCNRMSLGSKSRLRGFGLTRRARSRHRDRRPGRNMKNSSVDVGVSQDADTDQNLVQSRPIHHPGTWRSPPDRRTPTPSQPSPLPVHWSSEERQWRPSSEWQQPLSEQQRPPPARRRPQSDLR